MAGWSAGHALPARGPHARRRGLGGQPGHPCLCPPPSHPAAGGGAASASGGDQRAAGAGVGRRRAAHGTPRGRGGAGQPARPAPLHHAVLRRDPVGAGRAQRCAQRAGRQQPAQFRAAGRTGSHRRRERRRPAHRPHRRLVAAVRARTARQRHPPGAAPRCRAGALPHRWLAAQGVRDAAAGDDRGDQPDQGAVAHGPGRAPASTGWPHQDTFAGRARGRDARVHHADRVRREVRDAPLRSRRGLPQHRAAGLQPRGGGRLEGTG